MGDRPRHGGKPKLLEVQARGLKWNTEVTQRTGRNVIFQQHECDQQVLGPELGVVVLTCLPLRKRNSAPGVVGVAFKHGIHLLS